MTKKNQEKGPWDQWDGEYIGNIWGWKNSFISLGIILFFLSLMIYRYMTIDPMTKQKNIEKYIQVDTIGTEIEER